jgi:tRNA pseudouridine55 synthase
MATPATEPAGLFLVDKPAGITSHDVVAIVRRALRLRRVGHAGTLDPFATGLLVVLFGRGTRLIPYVPGEPKVYEAIVHFGSETETDDRTGTVTRTAEPPDAAAIDTAIARLTGAIEQVPPAYSAKQIDGTRAYAAACRSAPLGLEPVRVTVHAWELTGQDGDRLAARITCSGGTYIRALARDLGRLTGSAAHLAELRRTNSGPFSVGAAASVDAIESGAATPHALLQAIPNLPRRTLSADDLRRVVHGNSIPSTPDEERTALLDAGGELVAVADGCDGGLCPKVVFRDA